MSITDTLRRAVGDSSAAAGTPVRAVWNDTVLAESDSTVIVEGNHYFPSSSLRREYLEASNQTSVCPWKGTASYYDVVVDGERNRGAAFYYAAPRNAAAAITDRVAFWKSVQVVPAN